MKTIYLLLLCPFLAVVMVSGCGQSGQETAVDAAGGKKEAPAEGAKVSDVVFGEMISDWLKRNEAKMEADFSATQFRESMQSWFEKNKDQVNSRKFTQKEFDAMIAVWMKQGHGHEH